MTYTIKSNFQVVGLNNSAKAPLIWLIHGGGGDLHHYDTVVPVLIEAGFRVLVNDVRFHGLSQPVGDEAAITTAPFDFADVIEDMDSILQEVKREHYADHTVNLFVGGLSLGGMITLLYAADKGHADTWKEDQIYLKGLILLAAGIPYLEASRPGWEIFKTRQADQAVLEFMKTAIIASAVTESGRKKVKRAMGLVSNHALYECFVAIATLYPEPSNPPKKHIPLTTVPMLLIMPDQDPYTKEEMVKLHESNLEHGISSVAVTISDARHMVILDKGGEVGAVLRDFCNKYIH
jgi:pimeloyl-ACP methyl ester carboxylesterase